MIRWSRTSHSLSLRLMLLSMDNTQRACSIDSRQSILPVYHTGHRLKRLPVYGSALTAVFFLLFVYSCQVEVSVPFSAFHNYFSKTEFITSRSPRSYLSALGSLSFALRLMSCVSGAVCCCCPRACHACCRSPIQSGLACRAVSLSGR